MEREEYLEEEETEDGDNDSSTIPGLDKDGFPDAKEFNAAIAEVSAHVDAKDFLDGDDDVDEVWLDDNPEYCATTFKTLPEMDIILHNVDI